MMNIELARILQAEREREIETTLRSRRLLSSEISPEPIDLTRRSRPTIRPGQRPASSGAVSR